MAVLRLLKGPNPGELFALESESVVLGRRPDCGVVLEIGTVSRQHARITRVDDDYYVEDLNSRNGTFLNDQLISERQRLSEGDRLRICDVEFGFHFTTPESAVDDEELVRDLAPDADADLGQRVSILPQSGKSLRQLCVSIRQSLETNHVVFHPFSERSELQDALVNADPTVRQILGEGFYRLVVLDVNRKIDPAGNFDLARFYRYAFDELKHAFGLTQTEDYHEQDVMQILRDEPESLICLLNVHNAPKEDRKRLRSLTQEKHQTLIVYRHPERVGARTPDPTEEESSERWLVDDFEDTGSKIAPRRENPEVKLKALLEIGQNLGQAVSLNEVLPKVLDSLFAIFLQADRGFVVLKDEATDQLVPKALKHRREDSADKIRISRTIVREVMESREAILSADAATDSRFDMAQSIVDFHIHSMMCAPLVASNGRVLGVIQIDTTDQRRRFTHDDLDVLASVACQAAIAVENAQLHEVALQEASVRRELAAAHQAQLAFLPITPPELDAYEFFDFYEPARELGGDYFDYIALPGERVVIALGDVPGKGISAALLMAKLSSESRYCLLSEPTPAAALSRLNHVFCDSRWEDRFVTMILAVLDPAKHEVLLVNAGHIPPLVRRASGDVEPAAESIAGLPLGVADETDYEQSTISLSPGDCLTMYTDGIPNAMNGAREFYGSQRLEAQLRSEVSGVQELGQRILEDVRRFAGDQAQSDDLALVCFGRKR